MIRVLAKIGFCSCNRMGVAKIAESSRPALTFTLSGRLSARTREKLKLPSNPQKSAKNQMSKPVRSEEHKAFIRSLPCIVCATCGRLNSRNIDPCHTPGSRGMGQKRSDLDTIPMCRTHHDYQHQVGWPAFLRKYQLDILELLKALTEKPRIEIEIAGNYLGERSARFIAAYRGETFTLYPVPNVIGSIEAARGLCREHLIDTLFRPLVERQRHAG